MDLKLLLRYQISGSIFLGWFLAFCYAYKANSIANFGQQFLQFDLLKEFAFGIPIGAMIHQFSVSIKNQVLGKLCGFKRLIDSSKYDFELSDLVLKRYKDETRVQRFHEKISNLNTFYYLRFDAGLLAPYLALLIAIIVFCIHKSYSYIYIILLMFLILVGMTLSIVFLVFWILKFNCYKGKCNLSEEKGFSREKIRKFVEAIKDNLIINFIIFLIYPLFYLGFFWILYSIIIVKLNDCNINNKIMLFVVILWSTTSTLLLSYIPSIYKDMDEYISDYDESKGGANKNQHECDASLGAVSNVEDGNYEISVKRIK